LHCENNDIPLSGMTDLVNALYYNTTILYLPTMEASRTEALKRTEQEVSRIRNEQAHGLSTRASSVRSMISSKVGTNRRTSSTILSEQDINAALQLVDDSWDQQVERLKQLLLRNYNMACGIDTSSDVDEEDRENRPGASSPTKVSVTPQATELVTLDKHTSHGGSTSDVSMVATGAAEELPQTMKE
jgi:hypothetical protein